MGTPRGNTPPCPEVTTRSPTESPAPPRAMYLKRMVPRGSPSTMPGARVRREWAPTVDVGSVSTCTIEAPGRTSITRPTSPSGEMTAVSRRTSSPRPRLTVSERTQPPHSRAMISPVIVCQGQARFEGEQRPEPAILIGGLGRDQGFHSKPLDLLAQAAILGPDVLASRGRSSRC